jgi:predicted transcriptional regulator
VSQDLQEQLAEIKGDLKKVLEELEAIKAKMADGDKL